MATLNGSEDPDTLSGGAADDLGFGLEGNDTLFGGGGADTLFGGLDNDTLYGGEGADWINIDSVSGLVLDRLDEDFGDLGVDTLIGGTGNDIMLGLGDGTVFEVAVGDGYDAFLGGLGFQEIRVTTISSLPITIGIACIHGIDRIAANDPSAQLILSVVGDADFSATKLVNVIRIEGDAQSNVIVGTSLHAGSTFHDTIFGGGGEDTLEGGRGDDVLSGGADNDNFVFGVAEGRDTILDFEDGVDIIDLRKTNATSMSDLSITAVGSDTLISVDDTEITVVGVMPGALTALDFSFNSVWGSRYQDVINGNAGTNTMFGYAHDDTMYGKGSRDTLYGGGGADKLFGGNGNDYLDGGAGVDRYYGGSGSDTYAFARDGARDLVYGFGNGSDLIDLSFFGGIGFSDLTVTLDGPWTKIGYTGVAQTYQMWLRGDFVSGGQIDSGDFIF